MLIQKRGVVFDWIGLQWLNDLILEKIMKPLSKELFLTELDWRHSYIIGYKNGKKHFFFH